MEKVSIPFLPHFRRIKKYVLCVIACHFVVKPIFSQTLFTQNFDAAWTTVATISPAWTEVHGADVDAEWKQVNQYGASGKYSPVGANSSSGSARFNSYNVSSSIIGELISPTINFSTSGSKTLEFYIVNTDGTDNLKIYLSTDNGVTWGASLGTYSTYALWTKISVSLGASVSTQCKIKFTATSDWGNTDIGLDEVKIYIPTPMVYNSSTTTQTVTAPVAPFSVAQQIIGVNIVTTGSLSPFDASSFTFNTNGCTTPVADIICANLYYTGNSSTFSTAFSFGSVISQPNGTFTITGLQTLVEGNNYFWLTYDVPLSATLSNMLDAECTSLTVNSSVYTPSITNPGSGRLIANTYLHSNTDPVNSCLGAYYDDGGASSAYAQGTNYTKTFIPDAGKVMRITFTAFDTESGVDLMKIYDGPSVLSALKGTWSGTTSPGVVTATSATGELTVNFFSDNYTNTYAGWVASISCVSLPPNCATYTSPANGATNIATNTPIVWSAGATDATHNPATSYKLYFGTDASATNLYNGVNIGNVTSWGMMLNPSTTYYWKIVPVNASGDVSGCSTVYSFTTAAVQTVTVYNVPGSYASIKAAYDACSLASPYIINVKSGYAGEAYPIALNGAVAAVVSNRSAANPIIIRPDAGFSYTFTGAANKVFEFSAGAKFITIDGRQGGTGSANSFVFQNTSATTCVISFTGDCSNNTFKYCKIQGVNQSGGIIDLRSPVGSGIRNITIDNNEICPNGSPALTACPTDGIYSEGTNALKNTNITITNNKIHDIFADVVFASHGIYFGANTFNYGCTVSGNSIYFTSDKTPASCNTASYGILVKGDNHTISNNYVGGKDVACGGTSLTISGTKENKFYGLSVVGTSASSTTTVSGNTIRNIVLNTKHRTSDQLVNRIASSSNQTFAGLIIEDGSATVSSNIIGGTTSGDITVINQNTTNAATNNADPSDYGYSTELVGIVYYSKLGTINNGGNSIQGLWCYPASTATTNLNCRVIGVLACTDNVSNSSYTHKITNNTIGGTGGLKAGNNTASDGFVFGIITATGKGSVYITDNTISNLWVNSTGDFGYMRGIWNNGAMRCEIVNNTVTNLVCSAQNTIALTEDARHRAMVGIMCDNDGGFLDHFFVNKNRVYDLRSTAASAKVNLIGIYYRHAAAPVYGRVFGNKIYSINASSTDMSSVLVGIWAYGQNTITYNNMITLGSNVSVADGAGCPAGSPVNTGGYELRGMENNFGKNEYYYNSVNIIGTTGVGASNSYAYKYTNGPAETNCRVIKDNIFSNTRSSISGAAKHYALSINGNESCFTSDYNYYYVTGINGVLFDQNGTDRTTIAAWTAATGKDANSKGTSVTASPDPLFVDPTGCTSDLNITNTSSPVIGTGTTSGVPSYILDDFYGTSRTGSNDIGAVVHITSLPIELYSFTAEKKEEKNTLIKWITLSETNNDYFTIEHSSDGIEFSAIDVIKAYGNSSEPLTYQILDLHPVEGLNYYRLRQTDYDGKSILSKIVSVDFSEHQFMATVYPNPFSDVLNIDIETIQNSTITVTVCDMTGNKIEEKHLNTRHNRTTVLLGSEISDGLYLIKIQNASAIKYYKVVKHQ